jgi:ectoine hydroxylase-related dioxygenase (phytanoyl-CoA dioxygenase family)
VNELDADGYELSSLTLPRHQCEHLAASIPPTSSGRGGVRHLIAHPSVMQFLQQGSLGRYLWSLLGRDLVAVKATMFDKTSTTNWRVQWHQDRAIAIKERMDVSGYGPWSMKSGTLHVEPPVRVLEQMIAVRVHLDACGAGNGPLRVVPGSHRFGKISEARIAEVAAATPNAEILVQQGGILLMRPLLLHASTTAQDPGHRRVLHIELAPREAISPLQWHTAMQLRRAA